ncbi:MAG: hypothetical protein ACTSPU_12070, partial [Promethearchaeota archaeon]
RLFREQKRSSFFLNLILPSGNLPHFRVLLIAAILILYQKTIYVKKRDYFNTKTVIFQLSNRNFQLSWQKRR